MSARLDGSSPNLVLYLNSTAGASGGAQSGRNKYTVSARVMKIPGNARAEFENGLKSLAKKDFAGSLSHFTKAARTFPEYYQTYYHIGGVQTNLGPFDDSMLACQR